MVRVRVRPETGNLFFDFLHKGSRCREQTALADTPSNRKTVESMARKIDRAVANGTFEYATFFPDSPRAKSAASLIVADAQTPATVAQDRDPGPTLAEFAELWFIESEPRWRERHRRQMRNTLDRILLPALGSKPLGSVLRADLLGFRAELAKRPGRGGQSLSGKRINKLMSILSAILSEGCERYGIQAPTRGIKPLRQTRGEINPFSLDEVDLLVDGIRADYRNYLQVRMLTGLRTGEADGLQWEDVDFERGHISVRRTVSRGGDGNVKTESSLRNIPMVPQVRAALEAQRDTYMLPDCPWVFHGSRGCPVDAVNFTNRIWYPLLRHLGLKKRPPYQMRHTAATLMLASGENPEWVAQILGHSTTEMLFRVYSRFVPNLTRNDGIAFTGLLNGRQQPRPAAAQTTTPSVEGLTLAQKAALLAALSRDLNLQGASA